MDYFLYGLALLGSFSLGYSLLRLGFPEKQGLSLIQKVTYGYAIGILIFIPGFIAEFTFSKKIFFLVSSIFYAFLFAGFLAKRIYSKETDNVELVKENTKQRIPKKVLTEEEKKSSQRYVENEVKESQINNEKEYKKITAEELKIVNSDKGEQVFKEKKPSVIESLRKKTIEENKVSDNKKRSEALARLKGLAKQMDKKEIEEDDEDISEDELKEISEGDY